MALIWFIVLKLLYILFIIWIILFGLHAYCHYKQYDGTAVVLAERNLKSIGCWRWYMWILVLLQVCNILIQLTKIICVLQIESYGFGRNTCVCGVNWCKTGHVTCGRCHCAGIDITNISNPIKVDFSCSKVVGKLAVFEDTSCVSQVIIHEAIRG